LAKLDAYDLIKSTRLVHKRPDNNAAPFKPNIRIPVETMDSLEVWHCGGWVERFSCCAWLAAVCAEVEGPEVVVALRKQL
jgi:hypothetical protein